MAPTMKSFNPNKHLKEEFVSNLSGSSMMEIFVLIAILSMVVLIRRAFDYKSRGLENSKASAKKNDNKRVSTQSLTDYIVQIDLDFLLVAVPFTLFLTVLSEWIYILGISSSLFLFDALIFGRVPVLYLSGNMSHVTELL